MSSVIRRIIFLPKQSQRSRSVLKDGSRFLGLFGKGKIGIMAKFHRTDLIILSHFGGTKLPSYSLINTVGVWIHISLLLTLRHTGTQSSIWGHERASYGIMSQQTIFNPFVIRKAKIVFSVITEDIYLKLRLVNYQLGKPYQK